MTGEDEYSHLWDGREPGWCLVDLGPNHAKCRDRFVVYNSRRHHALMIENDDVHALVIDRLLAEGVDILPASALAGP